MAISQPPASELISQHWSILWWAILENFATHFCFIAFSLRNFSQVGATCDLPLAICFEQAYGNPLQSSVAFHVCLTTVTQWISSCSCTPKGKKLTSPNRTQSAIQNMLTSVFQCRLNHAGRVTARIRASDSARTKRAGNCVPMISGVTQLAWKKPGPITIRAVRQVFPCSSKVSLLHSYRLPLIVRANLKTFFRHHYIAFRKLIFARVGQRKYEEINAFTVSGF